jgi:hypothetical protein
MGGIDTSDMVIYTYIDEWRIVKACTSGFSNALSVYYFASLMGIF